MNGIHYGIIQIFVSDDLCTEKERNAVLKILDESPAIHNYNIIEKYDNEDSQKPSEIIISITNYEVYSIGDVFNLISEL